MKVLVVSAFPPEPAPEAAHAFHISKHLAEAGLSVHVLCKRGSGSVSRSDITVYPIMKKWDWSDLPALIQCIRSCRPDVVLLVYVDWVFGRHPMITFLPTIVKAVLPNTPSITQFENMAANEQWRSFGARVLRKIAAIWAGQRDLHWAFGALLRDSDHVICLSSPHRARALRIYPDVEEKSTVLPPPPLINFCSDPPDVARKRARASIGVSQEHFVWVYWGYIYAGKGIETLLRAFRIAAKRNPNLRLLLVGGMLEVPTEMSSSDYFRMVKSLPDVLGVADKVIWTGGFGWDSDAGSLFLYAGDACVLPLDWGITLNNSSLAAATTHGLPVIGTELHQARDDMLVHGQNIYLVPPRDPAMLAEAMELITESADVRERLREGSRKLAARWHRWPAMTKRLIAVLQAASSAARGRDVAQGRPEAAPKIDFHRGLSDASGGSR